MDFIYYACGPRRCLSALSISMRPGAVFGGGFADTAAGFYPIVAAGILIAASAVLSLLKVLPEPVR